MPQKNSTSLKSKTAHSKKILPNRNFILLIVVFIPLFIAFLLFISGSITSAFSSTNLQEASKELSKEETNNKALENTIERLVEQKKFDEAFKLVLENANKGDAKFQSLLALFYFNGWGVEKDDIKSFEWELKAAEQNYAEAQFSIGSMYEKGNNVEIDHLKALEWYKKAAEQGHTNAENALGWLYYNGKRHVPLDYVKAAELFTKAAEKGHMYAQNSLAVMYELGKGVEPDYAQAVKWYTKSIEQGNENAKKNLNNLYKRGYNPDRKKAENELASYKWHKINVQNIVFSPNGKYALIEAGSHSVQIWDVEENKKLKTFRPILNILNSMYFLPDNKHFVVTGYNDAIARIWDLEANEVAKLEGHESEILTSLLSPDSKYIVTGSSDDTVKVWDVSTNKAINTLEGHKRNVSELAFSKDGKYLATGSYGKIIVWDFLTKKPIKEFEIGFDEVYSISFSHDGKHLIALVLDHFLSRPEHAVSTIKIWDFETEIEWQSLEAAPNSLNSFILSKDDSYLVTSFSSDKKTTIVSYDLETGEKIHTFGTFDVFSTKPHPIPNTEYFILGIKNDVLIWDAKTGKKINTLQGHTKAVSAIAVSSNGQYILTGSYDEIAILWDAIKAIKK